MQKMSFTLDISAEQLLSYYSGSAKFVRVHADDGRSLKFPVTELQQFVSHTGVQGRFEILFNDQFKLVSLNRI